MILASSTWLFGVSLLYIVYIELWDMSTQKCTDRFFERIAKTYRRESWESLLHPLLSQWYKCAQQLGDVDLSVRLLVEMLGYGMWGDNRGHQRAMLTYM